MKIQRSFRLVVAHIKVRSPSHHYFMFVSLPIMYESAGMGGVGAGRELGTDRTLLVPSIDILAGHNAAAIRPPRHFQGGLSKLVSITKFVSFMPALDVLLVAGRPPGVYDSYGGRLGHRV